MRPLLFILGWLLFCLGVVGAFVPVLPTTPIMLLALWCFARSSDRFHDWLYTHRIFGPPLQLWHKYKVIPLAAKRIALSRSNLGKGTHVHQHGAGRLVYIDQTVFTT